ncbi:Olfactory receptor, insect [Cinara cedri]|uniref:Olfactory receptor, insect n=1 Tax=Cinara cedri TaxID=506608 RepID=A0A5E4NAC3_9HEMI|nr:Olfactory receptor, insect [Cinara cedri]
MECIIPIFSAYGLVTFDLFLIAILKIISTQYEIVASAYETLAYKYKDDSIKSINKKIFKDFLSITQDCQNIYKKLEIVYRITRPIVLLYMIGDALGLITMPYLIVMCYVQNGSSIYSSSLLTFLWTVLVVGIQSYLICSLFQLINEKKEAVNFGIYSCDWTLLDIKIKKLILLVMQINSSNNLKMNVTPTTFIDLPMFATIIRSSYSVTSVMINSNIHKL